ncbi:MULTISPECIES: LiaI-LiaF-like domain-containing protein [Giesbergeria]|uniref:LiaI-LiaF-like domain-containing protein n=1 Tax=Giesbergeria sinuosa TaxID=80883 RepID=A0ABV9QC07_9BURK
MKGNFAAIVLVLLGTFFLLNNLELINVSLFQLFRVWWPLILIVVGIMLFFSPDRRDRK